MTAIDELSRFRRVQRISAGGSYVWRTMILIVVPICLVSLVLLGVNAAGIYSIPLLIVSSVGFMGLLPLGMILIGIFTLQRRRELALGYGYLSSDPLAANEVDARSGVVIREGGMPRLSKAERSARVAAARAWAKAHPIHRRLQDSSTAPAALNEVAPIATAASAVAAHEVAVPSPVRVASAPVIPAPVETPAPAHTVAASPDPAPDPAPGGAPRRRRWSWAATGMVALGLGSAVQVMIGIVRGDKTVATIGFTLLLCVAVAVIGVLAVSQARDGQRQRAEELARAHTVGSAATAGADAAVGAGDTFRPAAAPGGVVLSVDVSDDVAPGLRLLRRYLGRDPGQAPPRRLVLVADSSMLEFWDEDASTPLDQVPSTMVTAVQVVAIDLVSYNVPPPGIGLTITVPGHPPVTLTMLVLGPHYAMLPLGATAVEQEATRIRTALHPPTVRS